MRPSKLDTKPVILPLLDKAARRLAFQCPEEPEGSTDDAKSTTPSQEDFLVLMSSALYTGHFSSFVPVIEHTTQLLSTWCPGRERGLDLLLDTDGELNGQDDACVPAVASFYKLMLTKVMEAPPSPPHPVDHGMQGHEKNMETQEALLAPLNTPWVKELLKEDFDRLVTPLMHLQ